ncbi:MAG TPA: substrate-binding domain-containing protein [Geminicoccaceae bacterium]|nr:substrate-binding domain-containing protein [Geminicoccaceae bacterium]
MHRRSVLVGALLAAGLGLSFGPALAQDQFITVASTTSTENSGLFGELLPKFQEETGIEVRGVAVGTGQAIELARNGDADVLFVHHKPSEEQFVAEGFGVERHEVMYNDFVIVGPASDPAGIKGSKDVVDALTKIAAAQAPFASRGDDSGTHKAELALWEKAGVDVAAASGSWYRETGSGMGPTLNTAAGMDAYALTDRGTWLSFENPQNLEIVVEGDPRLFNQYGIILVNPEKHPHVKAELGQTFIDWVLSDAGQQAIAEFKINGQQAFFPNAKSGQS